MTWIMWLATAASLIGSVGVNRKRPWGQAVAAKELKALRDENNYLTSKVAQNALDRMMTVDPDEERQKLIAQIHRYYAETKRLREALEEILCRVEAHARFHEETWDGEALKIG